MAQPSILIKKFAEMESIIMLNGKVDDGCPDHPSVTNTFFSENKT